jgi:hypothetical protein
MMKTWFYLGVSFLIMFTLFGCGGSAEVERMQAQQAMDKANGLHAADLAPTEFQQAQKAWDHGQTAEKEGKTSTAKVLFSSAKIYFGKASDIATSKHDSLSRELNAMQLLISQNLEKVQSDLSVNPLSAGQKSQVKAIVSEVEGDNASIKKLVAQDDLLKAVAMAKEVQSKIYNAQLILAGQSPKSKQTKPSR